MWGGCSEAPDASTYWGFGPLHYGSRHWRDTMSVPVSNRSASDGHAGLIRDIVDDLRESAAQSYEELSQATIDVLNRAADALESRPSLSVQSEEALADGLLT